MSTAGTMQPPAVPPRPSRSQEKDNGAGVPIIPPRPSKRFNRSISPNPDRFAPSPFNESTFQLKNPRDRRFSPGGLAAEPMDRSSSVDLPSIGQEGLEYANVIDELSSSPETSRHGAVSPEQTRTIGEDIKLHAPKPTMPAQSAKQRVATVTRTDSDRAASFGIGRPSSEDPYPRSLKKKASTTSQLSHDSHIDDEQGIPEIGQRVPLFGNAGDVQAPTPGPESQGSVEPVKAGRHHTRKMSNRGNLPSDIYGLHGHGVASTDKLEQAYYEKHPEAKKFELYNHHLHDRVNDYSRSSEELNKIVRDTASRGAGFGTGEYVGTPSEQVGFQATDEYTSRMSSPRPPSAASKRLSIQSPLKSSHGPEIEISGADDEEDDDEVIHVDEHGHRKGFAKFGNEESAVGDDADEEGEGYDAPILASDEVAKHPYSYEMQPAVQPPPERRGSTFEMEHPKSRPTSRPGSIYSPPPSDMHPTALDDVEEYEPLFPEEEKGSKKALSAEQLKEIRQRFPSRDIWEDAPNSVHATAEVSTPEPAEGFGRLREQDVPVRDGETPVQAFARQQEELAESEDRNPDVLSQRKQSRPRSWVEAQPHLAQEIQSSSTRPTARRFPSRDVWEDTPDSLQLQTTVSTPQSEKTEQSPVESKTDRPAIPPRPARKQGSGDDKPLIPERPKPQIPARPSKPATDSQEPESVPKQKPAVPARPVGGKIAALQAGFMSDLNKRLQLGPQAPKKEEPSPEEPAEETEKAPLADARKGRARGPQRRAPTKSSSPSGAPPSTNGKPVLSFSSTRTLWCIDEEGIMTVDEEEEPYSKTASIPVVKSIEVEESPAKEEADEVVSEEPATRPSETSSSETATGPEETKTLATNTAGESILEETLQKKPEGDEVEAVEATDDKVVS